MATVLGSKNGPALAGHGAEAVRDAIAEQITKLPEQLRRSLTWVQGAELAQHVQLRMDTDMAIYFCDRNSPWQRGTNENTNGLLRQYFPKGTDLARHGSRDLDGGSNPERQVPKDAGLEDTRRGAGRPATVSFTGWCCEDSLNPKQIHVAGVHRGAARGRDHRLDRHRRRCAGQRVDGVDDRPVQDRGHRAREAHRTVLGRPRRGRESHRSLVHWYNASQLHTSIGDVPPIEYERAHHHRTTGSPESYAEAAVA